MKLGKQSYKLNAKIASDGLLFEYLSNKTSFSSAAFLSAALRTKLRIIQTEIKCNSEIPILVGESNCPRLPALMLEGRMQTIPGPTNTHKTSLAQIIDRIDA